MSDASIITPGNTYFGPSNTIDTTNYKKVSLEGQPHTLPDQDLTYTLRSGQKVYAVAARNVSGIKLMPGLNVHWKAGYFRRRFDGYSNVLGESLGASGGIIDPNLTAGVRNGDICLIYVHGPCLVRVPQSAAQYNSSSTGVNWAIGDALIAQTGTLTGNTVDAPTTDGGGHLCCWNLEGAFGCSSTQDVDILPEMAANKVAFALETKAVTVVTQTSRVLVFLNLPMP
jgi:hypothetical protein